MKEEKLAVENKLDTISAQLELEKVKFETHKSEYESNMAILKDGKDAWLLIEFHANNKICQNWKSHIQMMLRKKRLIWNEWRYFKKSRVKRFNQILSKEQYELKIEEEIEKQRIVERKAAVTVRELKKQLSAEKKRAEKLAEKIKTVDSAEIETVATNRLSVPLNKDETSSIGSWSLPTGEFEIWNSWVYFKNLME